MCKLGSSMAKGYNFNEALGLCIKYMQGFGLTTRPIWDVNEEEGVAREVLEAVGKCKTYRCSCEMLHICMCARITRP